MAQQFATIASTTTLANSLAPLLARDDAAASCFSGTAFPSSNLLLGQLCYRTDQLKLYQLTTVPDVGISAVWELIYDLSSGAMYAPFASSVAWSGVTSKPTTVAGYGIIDAMKKTGDTATGKITLAASAAAASSLNVPHGAAPTTPVNGDVWTTTGDTRTVSMLDIAETYSAKKTFPVAGAGFASLNVPAGAAPTTPVNGDLWATTTQLVYRMAGVSKNIAFWDANSRIPLANGGTGASDAATARANLDVAKDGVLAGVVNKTTSFTLVSGDQGKLLQYDSASAGTCTIPPDTTWNADLGSFVNFTQLGLGQLQFVAGAGVTIRSANGYTKTLVQHSVASLVKVDANFWLLAGDLTA
jgi:hypothetical protein